jgi:diketogulonate reductase-like aldo/keto reductase
MANRLPSKPPKDKSPDPSRPTAPIRESLAQAAQAALDATVVELNKKSERVEELLKHIETLEKMVAQGKILPNIIGVSHQPRIAELEAFLRKCVKEGAINYTEAHELLNK